MSAERFAFRLIAAACAFSWLLALPAPAQPFALVPVETGTQTDLTARVPDRNGFRSEHVTAVLFDNDPATRKAAAVIINSSGGVKPHTELFWGRLLAANGMAALVVDSFTARDVARTTDDQTRLAQRQSDADAVAGFRLLAARRGVDPARIAVLGMSKGGQTALNDASPAHMAWLGAKDVIFAAHVALTPGGCDIQYRDAVTTNRPIFFMLADRDNLTPATNCLEFAERLRKAGNSHIERAVYPNVYHTMEWTGGLTFDKAEQNFAACRGYIEPDSQYSLGDPPNAVASDQFWSWVKQHCMTLGGYGGGDIVTKHHVAEDLLAFLRRHGFINDRDLELAIGDCGRFNDSYVRILCERGRGGNVGDIVALGRAFARGSDVSVDETQAARLFRLAADRDNPHGQFELALFLRNGRGGLPRDSAGAVALLRRAANQDYPAAMNELGVAYRDGDGVNKDDAEAARLFRRAALNYHSWALAELGQFYLAGRGGLARDPGEALRLFRRSALLDNPLGQYCLAGMLERGESVPADRAAALMLYRQSAAKRWDRKADAAVAVQRLEPAR